MVDGSEQYWLMRKLFLAHTSEVVLSLFSNLLYSLNIVLNIPAVCDQCNNFFPGELVAENSTNVTFDNKTVSPCPRCGATGHVPDGVYNFSENVIELVQGPDTTVADLQRLAAKFKQTGTPIEVKLP